MLRISIWNPSSLEKHFMRNLAQRAIRVSDSEILSSRTVEDRIQIRHPSYKFRLPYAWLAHPDALLHHFQTGGKQTTFFVTGTVLRTSSSSARRSIARAKP
jgi:hypothetical protein